MKRFKNILFVSKAGAGPETALLRAAELANLNGGRLTIVQMASPRPDAISSDLGIQMDEFAQDAEQEQLGELSRLADASEAMGSRPNTRLLQGDPFLAIIQEVLRNGHDLVMKTSEGPTGGFRSRLFGSTDQHLMRKCPCPVWLFKGGEGEGFRSVLAAVDVGVGGNPDLNRRILQLASTLSASEHAGLHVVHAWALTGESFLRSPGRKESEAIIGQLVEAEEKQRIHRLEALVEGELGPGAGARLHVERADPADGVGIVAASVQADVVVMGTLSRAGVRGLLIGNTAETVLGRLDCSVLTVKPDGFQTPVSL
jgi:nucleotide-binding universal stress UspA family protein